MDIIIEDGWDMFLRTEASEKGARAELELAQHQKTRGDQGDLGSDGWFHERYDVLSRAVIIKRGD
jgi:hypothetical protein